jgi:hypothetical protein
MIGALILWGALVSGVCFGITITGMLTFPSATSLVLVGQQPLSPATATSQAETEPQKAPLFPDSKPKCDDLCF